MIASVVVTACVVACAKMETDMVVGGAGEWRSF